MTLINCPECSHPLSSKAKICPNCSAPRKIDAVNNSLNNNPRKQSKMTKTNNAKLLNAVLFILIGAMAMYVTYPFINKPDTNPEAQYYARVDRTNGLYVYINSRPINQNSYNTLATMQVNDIQNIWKSLNIGKDNFGQVMLNAFNIGNENLVLNNLINKITKEVNEKYPDATGIIINDKLTRCEIIKVSTIK